MSTSQKSVSNLHNILRQFVEFLLNLKSSKYNLDTESYFKQILYKFSWAKPANSLASFDWSSIILSKLELEMEINYLIFLIS